MVSWAQTDAGGRIYDAGLAGQYRGRLQRPFDRRRRPRGRRRTRAVRSAPLPDVAGVYKKRRRESGLRLGNRPLHSGTAGRWGLPCRCAGGVEG